MRLLSTLAFLGAAQMVSTGWQPILAGKSRALAWNVIARISTELERCDPSDWSAVEISELALLSAYLWLADGRSDWCRRSISYLNLAITKEIDCVPSGLHGGACGVAWIIEHLSWVLAEVVRPGRDAECDDPLSEFDDFILSKLRRNLVKAYDLIEGLAGIGVYFLERLPRQAACEGLGHVLLALQRRVHSTPDGFTFHSSPDLLPNTQRWRCPTGYYNLGVAHGISGVIYFLAELEARNVGQAEARCLMNGLVKWLVCQRRPRHAVSWFPNWIVPGNATKDSRLSWCYGDIGIAAVLILVARRTAREDWELVAKATLDHALQRSCERVVQSELCHGALGIAHICNRVYQISHCSRYKEAAIKYYERALIMLSSSVTSGVSDATRLRGLSFLEGDIGVALALLSAVTRVEPHWDRRLILSGSAR